jgi:hypothetical protein
MRSRLGRLGGRFAELRLPAPERRAARAERRAEAALEAERRRWLGAYGEWRF